MENKKEILTLLKDCPKGMELYSPIFGLGKLDRVSSCQIFVAVSQKKYPKYSYAFDQFGRFGCEITDDSAECLLFPGKDHRTWNDFKIPRNPALKTGDIMIDTITGCIGYIEDSARVSSNFRIATEDEKDKWNDQLHKKNCHYSRSKRDIIHWFLPFDRVMVKNTRDSDWKCDIFSHYDKDGDFNYCCIGGYFLDCIPYNNNTANLLGTTKEYKHL